MKTQWSDPTLAGRFDRYDDWVEARLGYRPLIRDLLARTGREPRVLDYGCGGGKVVRRLLEAGAGWVSGVDIAPAMIERARAHTAAANADFHVIESGRLPFAPATFDAAVACYVFINLDTRRELQAIARAVHAALKPHGRFFLLDTNPETTGVRFTTFQSGEPGVRYADGDLRPVRLDLPDGDVLDIRDRHWERATYFDTLHAAGFEDVETLAPTAAALPARERAGLGAAEHRAPPFLRVRARKPETAATQDAA